jgi:ATP-binding cassette subfamily B protein
LALISLAVLPFDTLLASIIRRFYRKSSHYIAESPAELSAKSYDSLASIHTIQALGLELTFYQKLRDLIIKVSNLQLKSSLFENGTDFLSILFKTVGSLAYGWTQILQGNLSLGTYMAFSGYVGYLYRPVEGLISLLPQFESTLVHTKRFFEIYNLQPSIQDRADLPRLQNVQGEIAFHDVSFSYDHYGWIMRQVNLTIPAAATVALVGRNGSGKSTLAKLIPRFYDPGEG